MALPSGTDLETIGQNASGGMTLGASSSELVGFHGAAVAQASTIASLTASTTLTQLVVLLNSVIQALKDKGIVASS